MKKLGFMACMAGFLALVSCGGQTEESQSIDSVYTNASKDSIYSLKPYSDDQENIVVRGTKYRYSYSFFPDTTLAVVTNSYGFKYYDNVLDLTIYKDGEEFYTHRFTKKSFASRIPEGKMDKYAFLGFNFNYMKDGDTNCFHFIATVGDCDESGDTPLTFAVDITTAGDITLSEVQSVDEGPEEGV